MKLKNPTISVIMATYNHAKYVEQAINSVLAQQDVDFEFLIADDGSSDNTRDVVASIVDDRIRFFPNTINRGACVVTNELIQRATGNYIALINSDDYWSGDRKLSYQLSVLTENPLLGATFGRAQFVDSEGNNISRFTLPFGEVFEQDNRSQGKWIRRFFEHGNCICHPTVLIRRKIYDELGLYNNRLRQLPDFDMWIRLVKRYPIHVSEQSLINFRILPGENASSQTLPNSIRTINEHFLIAERFFDNISCVDLLDGFHDLLKRPDILSEVTLDIEKALLFLVNNQWLGRPYQLVALLKLKELLDSEIYSEILAREFDVDDRWFQAQLAAIDVLMAPPPEPTARIKRVYSEGGFKSVLSAAYRRAKMQFFK